MSGLISSPRINKCLWRISCSHGTWAWGFVSECMVFPRPWIPSNCSYTVLILSTYSVFLGFLVLLWHFHTLDPNFLLQASGIKEFLPWDLPELFLRPFVIYSLPVLGQFSKEHSVQFSSVTQSCLTLCDPMDCSTPSFTVYHQGPELSQTHAHWVGDAIQPSHPLSSPSPPALNLSQHQGLFQWVSSSHQVAKVLEFQLQHQSF